MDRREALKTTSLLLGFSMSATAVAAVMQGCTSEATHMAEDEWRPLYFEQDDMGLIEELCETIFPKTATPGAKDALVHQYVDLMMKEHYQLRDQQEFVRGLQLVRDKSRADFGKEFMDLAPDQKTSLLETMEADTSQLWANGEFTLAERPFFMTLKELTYIGYFTSEIVGEHHLAYDPIPGQYDGCTPLADIGNTWSL